MRCLDKALIAAYAARDLTQPQTEGVEAHLGACSVCRGLADALESSSHRLRALRMEPSEDRLSQIRARVFAQIAAQDQLPERTSIWQRAMDWRTGWLYLGAAAAGLAIAALVALPLLHLFRHSPAVPLIAEVQDQNQAQTKYPPVVPDHVPPALTSPSATGTALPALPLNAKKGAKKSAGATVRAEAAPAGTSTAAAPTPDLSRPAIPIANSPAVAARVPIPGADSPPPTGRVGLAGVFGGDTANEVAGVVGPLGGQEVQSIEKMLKERYPLTTLTADGNAIAVAGPAFTLKKNGLILTPPGLADICTNSYKAGIFTHSLTYNTENERTIREFLEHLAPRTFVAGEKLNITKIEVKDGSVVFQVVSANAYTSQSIYFHGALTFPVDKVSVPAPDALLAVTDEVFGVTPPDYSTSPSPQAPKPDAQPRHMGAIPMAPPASLALKLGMTVDQVLAQLGQPVTIAVNGEKQIYLFKDGKVTFLYGLVTAIEVW